MSEPLRFICPPAFPVSQLCVPNEPLSAMSSASTMGLVTSQLGSTSATVLVAVSPLFEHSPTRDPPLVTGRLNSISTFAYSPSRSALDEQPDGSGVAGLCNVLPESPHA